MENEVGGGSLKMWYPLWSKLVAMACVGLLWFVLLAKLDDILDGISSMAKAAAKKIRHRKYLWATRNRPEWFRCKVNNVIGLVPGPMYRRQMSDPSRMLALPYSGGEKWFVPSEAYFFSKEEGKHTVGTFDELMRFVGGDRVLDGHFFVPRTGYGNEVTAWWEMYPAQPRFRELCNRFGRNA